MIHVTPLRRHLRALYRENLAYADHQVGSLLRGLRERELLEDTVFILSSDHGEAFGEHGTVLHGLSLYEEEIHVPLVIRFPERFGTLPPEWHGMVELVDVVPTLRDALELPPRPSSGRSLLSLIRQEGPPELAARAWLKTRRTQLAAVISPDWKLIVDVASGQHTLYDLSSDPKETRDLAAFAPARVKRLETELREPAHVLRYGVAKIDNGTTEKIEALGYIDE